MILYSFFPGLPSELSTADMLYNLRPADQSQRESVIQPGRISAAEAGSDTRELIVKKALIAIEEIYDTNLYRFSLSPRWIPGSLQRINPRHIKTVMPEGSVERFTNFTVSYMERNHLRTAQVQLLVETERKLPVANRRISSGEVIAARDIDLRWVSVPYDRGQLVEQLEELSGKTIRRTLSVGEPVRHADVTTEYLIEAGDTIRMIFEQNGLRIEMEVEARQSGAQDEEISMYNKENRKRYLGRVSGPGIALWTETR